MDFQELLEAGEKRDNKRTSTESLSLNKEIDEAQAIQRHQADVQRVRNYEKRVDAKIEKDLEVRKQLRSLYGTDDPRKVAAIKATGAFDPDLAQRMQMDPEGTKAAVERAAEIAGKGGMQDLPDEVAPPERDYYRKNDKGILEFTNIPANAPSAEGWRRYNSDSGKSKDVGAPGGSFGRIGAGQDSTELGSKTPEDLIYEGRLAEARTIAGKPDRDEARAKVLKTYFDEKWDKHDNISDMRKEVEDDFMSGSAKKRGLDMKDLKFVEGMMMKRGKTSMEMTKPGIDRTYFKPWTKRSRPGEAADLAEPASVVNPGGSIPMKDRVQQDNFMAGQQASQAINESMPQEQTTMAQYAKGGKAKLRQQPSQVVTGGKGQSGVGGILKDINAFTEGEGRAGYGESGALGFMKDVGAFYGPRLPGDIASATLGGVTGKLATKGAKALGGIRAIENMFGLF